MFDFNYTLDGCELHASKISIVTTMKFEFKLGEILIHMNFCFTFFIH